MTKVKIDEKQKKEFAKALNSYKNAWDKNETVFEELIFCILTPQSSAFGAQKVIDNLKKNNLLYSGSLEEIEPYIKNVRFYKTKAKRILIAREKFPKNKIKQILIHAKINTDVLKCREFLVKEVNGYGLKEASHFLRNVGFFNDVAILDRHILRNLVAIGVISEIPKNLNEKMYIEIENKMKQYCKKNNIDFEQLDLYFWSKETGKIFK